MTDPRSARPEPLTVSPASSTGGVMLEVNRLCSRLEHQEIERDEFLDACARLVSSALGCSRAGVWVFIETADGRQLRCLAMYDRAHDRTSTVPDQTDAGGAYFLALEQTGYVIASDARRHFATSNMFARHLEPHGVHSLLAASFSVNGKLYGAFTCTQVERPVEWTPRQLMLLRQIGSRVSLSLFKVSRFTPDTGLGPLTS
jgi:GAF domain-containing protein